MAQSHCERAREFAFAHDLASAKLIQLLKLPIASHERRKIVDRVQALRRLFDDLQQHEANALSDRLADPDDPLAQFFDCELATWLRSELRQKARQRAEGKTNDQRPTFGDRDRGIFDRASSDNGTNNNAIRRSAPVGKPDTTFFRPRLPSEEEAVLSTVDPNITESAIALEAYEDKRGTRDRGLNRYRRTSLTRLAFRLGQSAGSLSELVEGIRRVLYDSRQVTSTSEVRVFLRSAFDAYADRHGISDADYQWSVFALLQEYKSERRREKRSRIGEIAEEIKERKLTERSVRTPNRAWQQRVSRLATESGLQRTYVEAFLKAYLVLTNPRHPRRHPGKIDPRSVPGLQLTAPIQSIADLVKEELLFGPGKQIINAYEAIRGETLRGKNLDAVERVLRGLSIVAAFAPRTVRGQMEFVVDMYSTSYGGTWATPGLKDIRAAIQSQWRTLHRLGWHGDLKAGNLAAIAARADISPGTMLNLAGRLSRLRWDRLRGLIIRFERARQTGDMFTLTRNERTTLDSAIETYDAFLMEVGRVAPPVKFEQRSRLGRVREAGKRK